MRVGIMAMAIGLMVGMPGALADEQHGATGGEPPQGQALTGEVVDVFCYLSHGAKGIGKGHAECAKKCITSGLPVAIKSGEMLYLASMSDHNPANAKLAELAGQQVTVYGNVMERDGMHFIAITTIEKAPEKAKKNIQ